MWWKATWLHKVLKLLKICLKHLLYKLWKVINNQGSNEIFQKSEMWVFLVYLKCEKTWIIWHNGIIDWVASWLFLLSKQLYFNFSSQEQWSLSLIWWHSSCFFTSSWVRIHWIWIGHTFTKSLSLSDLIKTLPFSTE